MFKKFRLNIIIRILLFSFFLFLFIELWNNTTLYAATFVVGIAAIFQIISLINYVEKTNRDLSRFLDAIKYSDFSQNFSIKGMGSKFDELNNIFSQVIKKFQEARAEKEQHFNYLQTIVQHVGIGLITFQKNGEIQLINNAARRLLNTPHMRNIRALKHFSEKLVEKLLKIKAGDKIIVKVNYSDDMLQLAIYGAEFKLKDKMYTLVSIQNIQTELEEQEMESWQKLIRVLTHEIMNSITPISSLAETINDMLNENNGQNKDPFENINDIQYAVSTIQKRSKGLHSFVEKYRSLTRLPRPEFRIFSISELFTHIHQLMEIQL
ncbi:MAG: ATP-binding protein, partial [Calditrichia bacterium]|nr:ATP-binding protein [Calditrichia bacterium]